MKTSNKIILIGGAAFGIWAYYITATTGEQVWMEELLYRAGYSSEMDCVITEDVKGFDWMVCRDESGGQGAVWAQAGDSEKGPVWAPSNSVARNALAAIQQLPEDSRLGLSNVRPAQRGEVIPMAPWEQLN